MRSQLQTTANYNKIGIHRLSSVVFVCRRNNMEIAVKTNWKVIFDYSYDLSTDSLLINVVIAKNFQRVIDNQLNYLNK